MMKNNYYLVKRLLTYFCLVGFPLIYLSSCQPDDDHFIMPEEMSARVYGRLVSDPDYSTFVKGVDKAGLKDILQRSGLYTAFAPTNAAWDEYLKANNYSSIESIPDTILVPLINYHFMEPMKFSFDFKEPTRFTTRANKHLRLNNQEGKFTVNGVEVMPEKMNGEAMNGAIHGIGTVLIAPPTLEQALAKRTDMKNFRQLLNTFVLRRFDAQSSRDSDGDGDIDSVFVEESLITGFWWRDQTTLLTAFAPTDVAFEQFFRANGYANLTEVPRNVMEILIKYHFLELSGKKIGELGSSETTIGDEILKLSAADVTTPDIILNNGYLHVTNKILFPPSLGTLTGLIFLNRDKDLTSFSAAVEKAAMAQDLADATKQYTVFAPTDAAFAAANINVKTVSGADLAKIVRYHILRSKKMAAELNGTHETHLDPAKKVTVAGTTITGTKNSATITQADKVASNGVLHKINQVLMPE